LIKSCKVILHFKKTPTMSSRNWEAKYHRVHFQSVIIFAKYILKNIIFSSNVPFILKEMHLFYKIYSIFLFPLVFIGRKRVKKKIFQANLFFHFCWFSPFQLKTLIVSWLTIKKHVRTSAWVRILTWNLMKSSIIRKKYWFFTINKLNEERNVKMSPFFYSWKFGIFTVFGHKTVLNRILSSESWWFNTFES
jgi:hypothetical protein